MLTVFAVPHSSSPASEPEPSSNAGAQSWNKVRAWFSRERGRAGKILQLALIGAARAASSASTNVATPTPQTQRHAMTNAAWESQQPEMESRLRETQRLTTLEWVGVRRAEEYQKMVDGALPPIPSETTEMGSRTHVVKVRLGASPAPHTHRPTADGPFLVFAPRESPYRHWTPSMMVASSSLIFI